MKANGTDITSPVYGVRKNENWEDANRYEPV